MNRRKAIGILAGSTSAFFLGMAQAAKKKKGKKKKGGNKGGGNNNQAKKLSGKVLLVEEKITRIYKLAGGSIYSFAKSVEDKVKKYEGQNVTIYGRVENGRIVTVEAITAS